KRVADGCVRGDGPGFRSINQHRSHPSPSIKQPTGGVSPRLVLRSATSQHASVQIRAVVDEPAAPINRCELPKGEKILDGLGLGVVAENHISVTHVYGS